MADKKRDLGPLTGALFVVLVLVAFIGLGGETPEGDESARKVVEFYSDHETKEILAALVLAISSVPLLWFSSMLREKLTAALPGRSALPTFAFAGGVIAAGGFLVAATLHFALADYGGDIQPAAAQAINAIDSDFFLPFTSGLAILVFATSLITIRTRLLPVWLGWVGVVLFVIFFTPAGFVAFGLSGIWIIVISILFYLRGDSVAPARPAGPGTPD
jgi:hypothetical protein